MTFGESIFVLRRHSGGIALLSRCLLSATAASQELVILSRDYENPEMMNFIEGHMSG